MEKTALHSDWVFSKTQTHMVEFSAVLPEVYFKCILKAKLFYNGRIMKMREKSKNGNFEGNSLKVPALIH